MVRPDDEVVDLLVVDALDERIRCDGLLQMQEIEVIDVILAIPTALNDYNVLIIANVDEASGFDSRSRNHTTQVRHIPFR